MFSNITQELTGKIISIEPMTSITVYKIETKQGIFEHTTFGMFRDETLTEGLKLKVSLKYSITLNNYFVYHVQPIHLRLVG